MLNIEKVNRLNEELEEVLYEHINNMLSEDLEDSEYSENLEELNKYIISHVKQLKRLSK